MSFFSVIIPLYNKQKFIVATLESVLSQGFTDFEVIIVNDGSTDESEQEALRFTDPRIRYYSRQNEGVSAARNFGISVASAEYISFIDADDYWYPYFLETMFANIHQFPNESVFSAAIEIATAKQVYTAHYSIPQIQDCEIVDYFGASQKESAIWTSCAVFHHSIFKKAGVFDIALKTGEDIDLWIRIGLLYRIVFCRTVLARYIFDPESLSKDKKYSSTNMNFSKFNKEERTHAELKRFLDLNRFSMAIKSKMNGDQHAFQTFYGDIDLHSLNAKKRILLRLPSAVLRELVYFQQLLAEWGLVRSPFK